MFKQLVLIALMLFSGQLYAQKADSIFVSSGRDGWEIRHKVKPGETVFSLARRYHIPPAMLSGANNITYQQELNPGSRLTVPLGAYNLLTVKPYSQDARPLYFRVNDEDLHEVARNTNVTQRTLQQWNNLSDNELHRGQVLLVGWVLYDNTDLNAGKADGGIKVSSNMNQPPVQPPAKPQSGAHVDTILVPAQTHAVTDTISAGEQLFSTQTSGGASVTEEKGTAAFFKRAGKSANGIFYALHNTAKRGTIIRIYNPGTGKTAYAKVIGPLPVREAFHNAILGLSSDAKAALEVMGDKVWCEISYAP